MKLSMAALAVALAATLPACPAIASIMTLNYQGVVSPDDFSGSDFDTADLFGGVDLAGKTIDISISYNTNLGIPSSGQGFSELDGGLAFYDQTTGTLVPSPITSATYSINGSSYSFDPDYYVDLITESGAGGGLQQTATSTAGDNMLTSFATDSAPATLNTAFSSLGSGSGYLLTSFQSNNASDDITFNLSSVSISATPEPSVWALMIVGVGLAGLGLRLRPKSGALQPA